MENPTLGTEFFHYGCNNSKCVSHIQRLYMGGPHRDNNGRQSIFGDPFCREVFCYTCTWSLATVSHSVGKTEMSGFMIMWLNRDEDNPHSQVKKKNIKSLNVACTVQP